jgi:protein tyrosine/serine phosphatase
MVKFRILSRMVCGTLLVACATRPTAAPEHAWNQPNDAAIAGVKNFGVVSRQIRRGAQPTAEGFRNLERAGVKTVLNLRSDHDDVPLLTGTHLKYLRIPMHAWDPDQGQVAQLVLVMATLDRLRRNPQHSPVFVHCAAGRDRTGYTIAAYRMIFENWSADDAIEEMFDFRFNTIYFRNPEFLRRLDVGDIRRRLAKAP